MSVFVSLIHNQSLTQCFQSVILSVTLIPHPAQQSNPNAEEDDCKQDDGHDVGDDDGCRLHSLGTGKNNIDSSKGM